MVLNRKSSTILMIVILFVFQMLYFLLPLPTASPDNKVKTNFPKSLKIIEDEAFSGIALDTLVFGEELLYIGENAFHNDSNLKEIYIPGSVFYIGETAFPKNNDLVINGIKGSYAQKWADSNCFEFVINDIWSIENLKVGHLLNNTLLPQWTIIIVDEKATKRLFAKIKKFFKSMRPQDRPELYPINYKFP